MTDASQRAKPITRRTKALTLIPGVIASSAATALVLTTTNANPAPPPAPVANSLPIDITVPPQVIDNQATSGQSGQVAPAVPNNQIESVVATTKTSGIPAVALNAYQHAAQVLKASDPSCHLPWELLGAIGRVESDHGQFGGSHLDAQGNATPPIYGPVLDGTHGTALIRDSDGGAMDGNATYDRAVGPMQFLPSTWNVVGVDGNGDGKRDPQNIYDSALAASVYLCYGHANMNNPADIKTAIYRYNHSDAYVALVTAIMNAYKAGNYTAYPTGTYAAASAPTPAPPAPSAPAAPTSSATTTAASPSASGSPQPSASGSPSPSGSATASPSAPMTAQQASAYCQKRMNASDPSGLTNLFNNKACTKKLTGMTPSQADAGWDAHKSNLAAWFNSPN